MSDECNDGWAPPILELRPEVAAFAQLMEAKLREKDHRGGWKHEPTLYLFKRLGEEKAELRAHWDERTAWRGNDADKARWIRLLGREAADVANFAMMIADVCGALAPDAKPGGRET